MNRTAALIALLLPVAVNAAPQHGFTRQSLDLASITVNCRSAAVFEDSGSAEFTLDLASDLDDDEFEEMRGQIAAGAGRVSIGVREYLDSLNDASPGYSYTVDVYYDGALVTTVGRSRTAPAGGAVGADWSNTRELKIGLPATLDVSGRGTFEVVFQAEAWVTCSDNDTLDQGAAKAYPSTTTDHAVYQAVLTYTDWGRLVPVTPLR